MAGNPSWYDILGVRRDASPAEIKVAWREATDRFEPGAGNPQFRLFNEAADVLLDPARRAAYDAELGPVATEPEPAAEPRPGAAPDAESEERAARPVADQPEPSGTPGWLRLGVLVLLPLLTLAAVAAAGYYAYHAHRNGLVEDARTEAPAAAERALESVLAYDYRHMGADERRAARFLTPRYQQQNHFAATYRMLARGRGGSPSAVESTKAVVTARSEASAVVDAAPDLARVLVFVNQTSRKSDRQPVIFQNRVVVTMVRSGNGWLIDDLKSY